MKDNKIKKPLYKRWWFITIVIIIIIGALGSSEEDTEDPTSTKTNKETSIEDTEKSEEVDNNITGDLKVEIIEDKIIATIKSNAIDGAIFETTIMDSNFETVSDFLTLENGEVFQEFDIPESWDIGYLSAISSMRFNLDDHQQPDNVKEAYGEVGEKLEGDLAVENNLEGKNISLETITIPYPDEATVKEKQDENFSNAINEVIELGDGIIVGIKPYSDNWDMVKVIVSDAWYYSQEHEKERFAEQVGQTVSQIITNTGQSNNEIVSVYFYDTYDKELASPKMFGGYKIKN